jgi:hypothetical protein
MRKTVGLAAATASIGLALFAATPAAAGNGSNIVAGLVGFGIGAVLGSMMGSPQTYVVPPPDYYGPVVYGPPPGYGPPEEVDYDGPVGYGPISPGPGAYGPRPYRERAMPPAARHTAQPLPPPQPKLARTAPAAPAAPSSDAKFKAALAKAKRDGVHTLTEKDIEGLSKAELKQIRGY